MRAVKTAGPTFVGLVMVAVLVATTGPSSGRMARAADEPGAGERATPRPMLEWSGYRIADTGKAAGGWIGARRWGRNGPVLYRVDPAASGRPTTYQPGRWVERAAGEVAAVVRRSSYDGQGGLDRVQVRQGAASRPVGRGRCRPAPPAGRQPLESLR